MRKLLLVVSIAVTVGGCAVYGPSWYRPGSTEAQFEAAAANCDGAALARFPPMTMGAPGYFSTGNEYCAPTSGGTNCTIIGSGYLPQARSAADTNEGPRENAFRSCMLAGGWQPYYPAAGEPIAPPARVPDAAVRQALTDCRSIFGGQSNSARTSAKFDQCVVTRARELSGTRPPA